MSRCKRLVATASARRGYVFSYERPTRKTDLKREGRSLRIGIGNTGFVLDGCGINMLKGILRACGEIGRRVDKKKAKVRVLDLRRVTV